MIRIYRMSVSRDPSSYECENVILHFIYVLAGIAERGQPKAESRNGPEQSRRALASCARIPHVDSLPHERSVLALLFARAATSRRPAETRSSASPGAAQK